MLGDYVIWALVWLLMSAIVDALSGRLAQFGVPSSVAQIVICLVILAGFYKSQSDRYLLRRWRRKLRDWNGHSR